ncbi:hydroxyacylglutathione hydrolase [Denitromonas ohlonensis]|uniref:Hydroxyacylglutathione hydrolase n=2 Tax=Denitromonas TaxID=139331 RepID=A0A557SJ67_9RHOO|nr:hydroxyacylglutathione hydrolase [Denitromonas ohlonensis]TVO69375.1 hydroxyacylglutathione hydrolase [Denitromonas ohlonensis]TVO77475.1 hydroxyacylglutathione hydrolase [Denitromonas ohlonensis]
MRQIVPLPAFKDNYIWLMHDGRNALVVDPGDAAPVQDFIAQHDLTLAAVLITHHHADHIGGLAALAPQCPVYGPATETIEGVTHTVHEPNEFAIPELALTLRVLDVPGHTRGHIAYYAPGLLFCGDTLFSAGCGRIFEGTPAQLLNSLNKLAALPDDTQVYCTHEYTLANLAFAQAAEPDNLTRDLWLAECTDRRLKGLPTLPSTIGREKAINPFLRPLSPSIRSTLANQRHQPVDTALTTFTALREWKNTF